MAQLIIEYRLDAPREKVFQAWTKAEHMANWWGPAGFDLTVLSFDGKPGGHFHFGMKSPDGYVMYGLFTFISLEPLEKLVYINAFADENGNVVQPPFSAVFPLRVHYTVDFADQDGQTIMTLTGTPFEASQEAIDFYTSMLEDMRAGFTASFDNLAAYLKR